MLVYRLLPPPSPIHATVSVPGSKSYTNRALLMAALAPGVSRLSAVSMSSDSEALIAGLRALGISIVEEEDTTLIVKGSGGVLRPFSGTIDVGPAGTTMRFLTALYACIPGADIIVQGSERMHARPIRDLVEALRAAGAEIDYIGTEGYPPLRIHSTRALEGGTITIDGTTSSQFISALLLSAPLFTGGLSIKVKGEQISTSYLDMTLQSVNDFGLTASHFNYTSFDVASGQTFVAKDYVIEGDASGASYLWGIAAVSQGRVTVENINPASAQGDSRFPYLLEKMGCAVNVGARSITVTGPAALRPIEVDMTLMPDTAQTLSVIAACAQGTSVIRGLKTLRIKETDRIVALQKELGKMGVRTEAGPDYIVVHGTTPAASRVSTYEDHRMAMSFALLAGTISGIEIEEPGVVEKSFPTFWEVLRSMGVENTAIYAPERG